jgi:hypothetical protein
MAAFVVSKNFAERQYVVFALQDEGFRASYEPKSHLSVAEFKDP